MNLDDPDDLNRFVGRLGAHLRGAPGDGLCWEPGPWRHPTEAELQEAERDIPPNTAYVLNPSDMIVGPSCQLASGHDGPHDWEGASAS